MKINQMKKDEFFEGFYLIKTADVRQTRAGKDYLALTFQDDTGEIEGKVWDAQPGKSKTLLLELLFTCRVAVRFTTTPP